MTQHEWDMLPEERRRVLLRQYIIPVNEMEDFVKRLWIALPRYLRHDLDEDRRRAIGQDIIEGWQKVNS